MGDLERILQQNRSSINVSSENLSIKTFSKYLLNQKCLQTCQMELPGGNLARGFPLWVPFWKKMSENAETRNWKIPKKYQFLYEFSSNFNNRPLYTRTRQCSSLLQWCTEALRATHKKIWAKNVKKWQTPILGRKIDILVNKKCFNQKTSVATSSYTISWWPHTKFEANRRV